MEPTLTSAMSRRVEQLSIAANDASIHYSNYAYGGLPTDVNRLAELAEKAEAAWRRYETAMEEYRKAK